MRTTASFRNVSFHVSDAPAIYGRDVVIHEYPYSDSAEVEDTGKKFEPFKVVGFAIGKGSALTRDLIIRACETKDPGKLLHPIYGEKTVVCKRLEVNNNSTSENYFRFEFEFVEVSNVIRKLSFIDKVVDLIDEADRLILGAIEEFNVRFSVLQKPAFVVNSAANLLQRISDAILSQNALGAVSGSVLALSESTKKLKFEASQLVRSPAILGDKLAGAMEDLVDSFDNRIDGIKATTRVFSLEQEVLEVPFNSKSRIQEKENAKQLNALSRYVAIAVGTKKLGAFIKETSISKKVGLSDLLKIRGSLVKAIDQMVLANQNYELFDFLMKLKTSLLKTVPGATEIPDVRRLEVKRPETIFTICYSIYGHTRNIDDLIIRNSITHPLFILPGQVIEYVDD